MDEQALMESVPSAWRPFATLTLALLSSCGAGVAGVVAGSGTSGGGGSAPTVLTAFRVPNPKVSPAKVQLGVSGTAPIRAGLFYQRSDQARQPMTKVAGVSGNTVVLAEPGAELSWDFAAEPFLENERFVDSVTLMVEFPDGIPDGGVIELGMGNDPPVIEEVVAPTGVLSGVIPVGVRVSDSSSDVISITLEWRPQGEPDEAFEPATPASVFQDEEPLEDIQASPEGVARTFSWNTAADLLDEDADVELRFTPDDGTEDAQGNPVGRGDGVVAAPFRIENRGRPILTGFGMMGTRNSPARLELVLVHAQSEPVAVELLFAPPGGALQRMTQLGGGAANPVLFPSSPAGVPSELEWDFAAEPALVASVLIPDVRIRVVLPDGVVPTNGELVLALGNDPPSLEEPSPLGGPEVSSVVPVRLRVADSSGDLVSIRIEYDLLDDDPDAGFLLARPAGLEPSAPTPEFAVSALAMPAGTELLFFWDTDFDLAGGDDDVVLRVTGDDGTLDASGSPVGVSEPVVSALFHVDNNEEPIVQLDSGLLILNPDERRGIPIPFRVIDEESDLVEVILQWRREGEEFPELPTGDIAALDAILADAALRQEKHICTPYPNFAKGRLVPIDANTVRLPDLASSQSWILASGIEGRMLELLRPSNSPEPITPTWRSNPLLSPITALPVGDGLTALVLDVPGNGRLREIELATGEIVREIATLAPGIPSAMAFERGKRAVLVALDDAGTWRIERVELATGALRELLVSSGAEPAPVRGIASLGANTAVFTAGSALLVVDYRAAIPARVAPILEDLATPFGVVLDPLNEGRLYLAERDAPTCTGTGRILSIDLDSHGKSPVVVKMASMQSLEQPEALALARKGARLLVLASDPGGGRRFVGLDLGGREDNVPFALGAPIQGEVAAAASGPDGLLLIALPGANELLVGGGLEQRRMIEAIDPQGEAGEPRTQLVTLAAPLEPHARPGQPWRIPYGPRRDAKPAGVDTTFVWDSADSGGGSVFLRALPRNDETGTAGVGAAPKSVRTSLDVDPLVLGGFPTPDGPGPVAAADLDGDGDLDLVSANAGGDNLTLFFQEPPGSFVTSPLVLGGPTSTVRPRSVAVADIDGDGNLDLVSANAGEANISGGNNLTIFFQLSPGSFATNPLVLGGPTSTARPRSVAAADLDGDGDQDLVSANAGDTGIAGGNNLTVFFQLSPGRFTSPQVLGGPTTTVRPHSVAAADLDGDGDQDLVSANQGGDNLTVFFQEPPGSFATSPQVLGGFPILDAPVSVATADLDGDGDQDLVSANQGGDNLTVFFQEPPGSFATSPQILSEFPILDAPVSVAAADLDGDGDQDLVSANSAGDNLTVFFQESSGSFATTPQLLGGPATMTSPASVAAADLDGDGDQDLVSANESGDNLTVLFQESPGVGASSSQVLGGFPTTIAPFSVAAADLDSDGDQDLVSANADGNNLTVFLQRSPGSFGPSPQVLGGPLRTNFPFSVAAADLDGDGDQDLVSANADGNNLTVFFQALPGSFAPNPLVRGSAATTNAPGSVAAADLDGDGDQDLVSANVGSNNLTVFFQELPGSFTTRPLGLGGPATTRAPVSVAAADLDGDGDQDLVSANADGSNLTVFFQELPGSFAPDSQVLGGPASIRVPFCVAAADLDGDGDLDLVSANVGGDDLTIFLQESPGRFATGRQVRGGLPAMDAPVFVAAADLDGDGDQELVSANAGGDNLTIFLQESPGSFATSPQVLGDPATTPLPRSVAAADLDGDGDQDLVSANDFGNNLRVFWGGR